ncbi:anti-sigma-D factor RsdA [Gordonia rhizosphera]|uniref:Anti-sigma-D factor RsdA sigma factor binding region domain-containing protein n=1 Tax=Gordonia rhizosphera NBRC 16068 TaxID=1108045 RepID=K6WKR5_9ACTN|nr:anti-sigma-D factor RsdA [Gordonia rhizosphera]GAB92737.1 hypothetical protein GORHZ_189_00110 [Gordonia rhizosphera NBRC 16068]
MNAERDPAEPRWETTEPIDMMSVQADDRFIEALTADLPVTTHDEAEYQLAELLSGWRHETLSAPPPELPTVEEVENAIAATERARRGRGMVRHLRVASGVAAIVVVAVAGLTVLAEGASPGDPLWGVKRVVFASAASETQASVDVQSNLEKAEAAVAAGDTTQAEQLIAEAEKDLAPVRDQDTRNRMTQWMDRLRADATTKTSSETSTEEQEATSDESSVTLKPPTLPLTPTTPPRDLQQETTAGQSPSVTVPTEVPSPSDILTPTNPEVPDTPLPTPTITTTLPVPTAEMPTAETPTTLQPTITQTVPTQELPQPILPTTTPWWWQPTFP